MLHFCKKLSSSTCYDHKPLNGNPENTPSLHHSPTLGSGTTLHICSHVYSTLYSQGKNKTNTSKLVSPGAHQHRRKKNSFVRIQCFPTPGFQTRLPTFPRGLPQATKKVSNYSFWLAHLTFQSQMVPREVIWSKTFRRQQGHQAYTHKRKITNPNFPELRSLGLLTHTAA